MDKSAKTKLISDIENQLDDFFSDPNEVPSSSASEARHPIEKLKSAVLSIDWEITDACLSDLISETEVLLARYENDPITHALLRMLRALGRYIRKRKAQAHKDAIKRIMSVFASLEMLVKDPGLDEERKKRIVAKEIQAFKKLKEQIEAQLSTPIPQTPAAALKDGRQTSEMAENHQFKQAMMEMEEKLHMEVNALKRQLASLQKELEQLRKS